jgi:hypothetical protein
LVGAQRAKKGRVVSYSAHPRPWLGPVLRAAAGAAALSPGARRQQACRSARLRSARRWLRS